MKGNIYVSYCSRLFFIAIVILSMTMFLGSCEKEAGSNSDIVEPGSYYPAYPGSNWIFMDSDSVMSQVSVLSDYQEHSYSLSNTSNSGNSSTKLVPQLDNGTYIYEYKTYVPSSGVYSSSLRTFLIPTLDASYGYSTGSPSQQSATTRLTTAVDLTVVVNGVSYYPTIEVKKYHHPSFDTSFGDAFLFGIYYYTKDVGLIKMMNVTPGPNNEPPTITYEKSIVDYYINN